MTLMDGLVAAREALISRSLGFQRSAVLNNAPGAGAGSARPGAVHRTQARGQHAQGRRGGRGRGARGLCAPAGQRRLRGLAQ